MRAERVKGDIVDHSRMRAIHRAFNQILELPDIPGPGVILKRLHSLIAELGYLFSTEFKTHPGCKMGCQKKDVLSPLSERG